MGGSLTNFLDSLNFRHVGPLLVAIGVVACSEGPQPRTVSDFLEDPIGLEATLTRCNADRGRTRDEPECVNAREANNRLAAEEQRNLERELELESQRKLDAIRRRNEAAAEAARRAEEAARAREEALYEQQFENLPVEQSESDAVTTPEPIAPDEVSDAMAPAPENVAPAMQEAAPVDAQPAPPPEPAASDLEALRQEMNRRNSADEPTPEDQPQE